MFGVLFWVHLCRLEGLLGKVNVSQTESESEQQLLSKCDVG